MPCKVQYAVELDKIFSAGKCRFDQNRQILFVPMPDLTISSVEPILKDRKMEPYFSGMRFKWYDSSTVILLENSLLKKDYSQKVREENYERKSFARNTGKTGYEEHLQKIFRLVVPELIVKVEN